MINDLDWKLEKSSRVIDRRKRDTYDDSDMKVRYYDKDSIDLYSPNTYRIRRSIDKIREECSAVQNYGPPLIIDSKDLDSIKGVYIP